MNCLENNKSILVEKIKSSKEFNDLEKSILIQRLRNTKNINNTPLAHTFNNQACINCSNNPKNGGSGICHCTLGSIIIQ